MPTLCRTTSRTRSLTSGLVILLAAASPGCNFQAILQAALQGMSSTGLVSGGAPGSFIPISSPPSLPTSPGSSSVAPTGSTVPPGSTIGTPGKNTTMIPGIDTNQGPLQGAQPFQTTLGVPLHLPAEYAQSPRFVARTEWDPNPPRSAWAGKPDQNYGSITVHHTSGGEDQSLESIKSYHQSKGWIDIGYHFLIRADGTIYEGTPLGVRGTHSAPNEGRIGVSLLGNFETSEITDPRYEPMRRSLEHLIRALQHAYPATQGHLRTHKDERGGTTDCPGRTVIAWLDGSWEKTFAYRLDFFPTTLDPDDADAD